MTEAGSRRSFGYRPYLDGMRAVAVLSVVLFHCEERWFVYGYLGVDTFFVLSGFLITIISLMEIERTSALSVSHFFARRVRRLLPSFAVVTVLTASVYRLYVTDVEIARVRDSFFAAVFYWENYYVIDQADDYWAQDSTTSPLRHCWSLSVEEQFYLAFAPAMAMLLCAVRARVGSDERHCERVMRIFQRCFAVLLIALASASMGYGAYLTWYTDASATRIYMDSLCRLYQLVLGSAFALFLFQAKKGTGNVNFQKLPLQQQGQQGESEAEGAAGQGTHALDGHSSRQQAPRGRSARLLHVLTIEQLTEPSNACVMALVLLYLVEVPVEGRFGHLARGVLCTCTTVLAIATCERTPSSLAVALLSTRPLVLVGQLSYSIYLWHFPIYALFLSLPLFGRSWVTPSHTRSLLIVCLSFVFAYATRVLVEVPCARIDIRTSAWKRRLAVAMGVAGPILIALLLVMVLGAQATRSSEEVFELIEEAHEGRVNAQAHQITTVYNLGPVTGKLNEAGYDVMHGGAFPVEVERVLLYDRSYPQQYAYPKVNCKAGPEHFQGNRSKTNVTVGVFGDSHAWKVLPLWVPASHRVGFRLHFCHVPGHPIATADTGTTRREANSVRAFFESMSDLDYIVIHNFAIQWLGKVFGKKCERPIFTEPFCPTSPPEDEIEDELVERIVSYMQENVLLHDRVKRVFLIAPEPLVRFDLGKCISEAKSAGDSSERCEFERAHSATYEVVMRAYFRAAKLIPKLIVLNIDELLCPGAWCPATANGIAAFPDKHHVDKSLLFARANGYFQILQRHGLVFNLSRPLDP